MAGPVRDGAGNLYGTTYEGGEYQAGTIFKLTRDKTDHWKETILFEFPKVEDGAGPTASLVLDAQGSLYGTAGGGGGSCSCGVVFKMIADSRNKWGYTVRHRFTGPDGQFPQMLSIGGGGKLYGTTNGGGMYGYGVIFEITP